jgi:hypothetical protein
LSHGLGWAEKKLFAGAGALNETNAILYLNISPKL